MPSADLSVVDSVESGNVTRDCMGDHCAHFVRHDTDLIVRIALVAIAIYAEAARELTDRCDVFFQATIGVVAGRAPRECADYRAPARHDALAHLSARHSSADCASTLLRSARVVIARLLATKAREAVDDPAVARES